ncbi:MAG: ribosome biogenesis GTP-binding protein YihA/YsxC, partial [Pseudomonadota bacterium]
MSHYPNAKFVTSANAVSQLVPDEGTEIAFAGRSNAGKSSAINTIVNRRQFARTSKTPGRTQLINFFSLAQARRLVDLPGYGFARVAPSVQQHWQALMEAYFAERSSLVGLFLIVDIRRGIGDFDEQMLAFATALEIPVHTLLTKADKLKRGAAATAVLTARKALGERGTAQLFSSLKKDGVGEAQ